MKIALDAGPLSDGNAGRGVGVYTNLLYKALQKLSEKSDFFVEAVDVKTLQDTSSYDVVHYPSFDFFRNTLRIPSKTPVVVTIHDTIPLIYKKHYPAGIKGTIELFRQKRALQQTAAIVTDSETSRKDIVRFLHYANEKIFPVYLGPTVIDSGNSKNTKVILKSYGLKFPYILYIGDVNWNKNLVSLCKACDKIKTHLVIVGKRAVSDNYDKHHIENRPLVELQSLVNQSPYLHAIGFVSDEELPTIIKNAELLCQPSYYEGFGLSVLDAMCLGTPTVCAKTQALVEIYESGTTFFDPYSIDDMSETLHTVFNSDTFKAGLRAKGKKLAQEFSWEKTAHETLAVYNTVLSQK